MEFMKVFMLCLGSFFFGGAVLMYMLISFAARNGSDRKVDNAFGFLLSLIPGGISVLFFYLGLLVI